MTTVLLPPEALRLDAWTVDGDAYRHLFRARRHAVGDTVRVVDGEGRARWTTVSEVGRRKATLALGAEAPSNEPKRRLTVFVAAPKVSRASWMVEKLTEVGAGSIFLWATARAPRRYGEGNLERLRRVAAAAVEQCDRSCVPVIENLDWEDGLSRLGSVGERWLLRPEGGAVPARSTGDEAIALLIGPEGGWTEKETRRLEALPCRSVSLGPTILRVETAAVTGAALALCR